VFPVEWRVGDGTLLLFDCGFTAWSDFDAAWAFDWHPADATTWDWIDTHTPARPPGPAQEPSPGRPTTWRAMLRAAREARGLSRNALAARAGLHGETAYAYEAGRRAPNRHTLLTLCRALEMDWATANSLLSAAGFEPEPSPWSLFAAGSEALGQYESSRHVFHFSEADIARTIDEYAWPCLVVNGRCEVVCANQASEHFLGLNINGLALGLQRNLVALVTDGRFRARVVSWAQTVTSILPGELEPLIRGSAPTKEAEYFRQVVEFVRQRDAESGDGNAALGDLFDAWRTRPNRQLAVRVHFPLDWRGHDEVLRFNAIIAPWNTFDPYWSIALHPADAVTWRHLGSGRGLGSSP
jgi:transcriptional regulator with XRE-family HTH domain